MDYCWCKFFVVLLTITTKVSSIPLHQFFPFGSSAGDQRLTLRDDDSSPRILMNQPFTLLGRQRNSFYVNSNGVISLQHIFPNHAPRNFPYTTGNQTILCPFWDDIDPSMGGNIYHSRRENDQVAISRATQLIQTTLGHSFHPTAVFTATWDHVPQYGGSSVVRNTFQCVLASGREDTFLFFLYADNLIQWTRHNAQVGVDGGDGVNYYNSLTPEIINITHTSNVNTPGLWILKVDNSIIAGVPSIPHDLLVTEIRATTTILRWKHSVNNSAADSFTINCTGTTPLKVDIHIEAADQILITLQYLSVSINNTFSYSMTGLEEYTNYTCTISARNVFGQGTTSESIVFITSSTAPSGPPNHILTISVSSSTFHLEWSPPSEEDRNGLITGYRILLDWDMGQELRATTTHTNYTFTGLQQDTDYYYRIAAETSAGLGPFSNRTLVRTLPESSKDPNTNTETTREAFDTDTVAERKGLNLGVICGAGGAGVLLLMLTIATLVVLCACKRKKYYKPKATIRVNCAQLQNKAAAQSTVHGFNHYDKPPVSHKTQPCSKKAKKKPLMPKHLTSSSKPECSSSDGVYMSLNPARMETSQNQDQQYMTISAASRKGVFQTSKELKEEEDVVYEEIDKKLAIAMRSTTNSSQQDFNYYVNITKTV